jgi:hypothetical protein
MRTRLTALVAVLGMVLAACGGTSPEAAGPSEGIQVHGDWTIEVYNEDGSLDRSVAFKNAFQGETAMTTWLSHGSTVGPWSINMYSAVNEDWPCVNNDGVKSACNIMEQFDPPQTDTAHTTFTLSVTTDDRGGAIGADDSLVLGGAITASSTGEISIVQTTAAMCSIDDVWPACSGGSTDTFTYKELDAPIPVTEGQLIDVEVVISFTSG